MLVADAALEIIPDDATAIGGLTVGADPVAYGVAAVARDAGPDAAQLHRPQGGQGPRGHGRIAGALQPGDRVVITEDTSPAARRCSRRSPWSASSAPSRC